MIYHRDYFFSGSILVSIFDDRLEIVTLGGLPKGLAKSDVMLGISVLRNKNLGNIFYHLHLIEAYGTGIPKIVEGYAGATYPTPSIEVAEGAFKITLFSANQTVTANVVAPPLSKSEETILQLIKSNGSIRRKDIEVALSISQPMAIKYLKGLLHKKVIQKVGQGKNTTYLSI